MFKIPAGNDAYLATIYVPFEIKNLEFKIKLSTKNTI